MPDNNRPSGGDPYLRACFAVEYVKESIVDHGGRHSGLTPQPAFRFSSQMWPPPSKTAMCPQSARNRNPLRPSNIFSSRKTAGFEGPDFFMGSRELQGAPLRRERYAPVRETRQCCRLGKHCGQRRRPPLPTPNFTDNVKCAFVRGVPVSTQHQDGYGTLSYNL